MGIAKCFHKLGTIHVLGGREKGVHVPLLCYYIETV